ncbi:DNA-binding transcriptional regulator, MarR family [Geodermatophilus telluris]|uniref:DNA-binding transcriptional regulator, MarR family n=1 Tax=Geodermatophilus telluris TaxID=1190417 RepID=A0A1G6QGG1_9ACTN|nr:MarR family winged helix-turn-helix transcriptional regulator [Geodermatophilus telluris]SDC91251.1 DNA-binding transcriptional regulator, MarR family [Geodermatophilus telluris]
MSTGEPPLAALLLVASRRLDAALRAELAARGWPRLSGAQSLVFAFLDPDGTPPAELARRLGSSRQATQDLVAGLVRTGLLEVAEDPARRGGRLVRLTASGRALAADAGAVLAGLEAALGERAAALRRLLAAPLDLPAAPPGVPRDAAG